ncbi:MAG: 2-oxo acid dehydrogenase subunit E2, partial [Sedimenticola sp.]|nr:2-oxo acid dehydrogenase subunit E2 [Sedimenticola sp.]
MSQLIDIIVPQGEQQGTAHVLANWLKLPGQQVSINSPLVDIETDKVMVEVPSPASGVLKDVFKNPGDDVTPGTLLGRIEINESANDSITHAPVTVENTQSTKENNQPSTQLTEMAQLLSPAVRRLVKKHRVNIEQIEGSGKRGRVTKQDVLSYLEQKLPIHTDKLSEVEGSIQQPITPAPISSASNHIPHTSMRRRIASHMTESLLHTAPHVTSIFEMDLSAISQHRTQHKTLFEQQGIKLTFTAYFVYAAVQALQHVPEI